MKIREIPEQEIQSTLAMICTSFNKFIAPDYTKEGVGTFYELLHHQEAVSRVEFFGAYDENEELVGVLAARRNRSHICFFFAEEGERLLEVGGSLFEYFLDRTSQQVITVNASPYARGLCQELGFQATDCEKMEDGIVFTPMRYERAR